MKWSNLSTLSSFCSKPEKFTWWHFQNTSKEVIWTICFLNFMHRLNSAIFAILQRGLGWLCPVSVALKKISTFFFKLQHIVFWDIEGNTETSVTEKTRRNWKGNWSRTRTRKKLLTVSTVISFFFMYPLISCMKSRYVLLKQKKCSFVFGKLPLVEQKKCKHLQN